MTPLGAGLVPLPKKPPVLGTRPSTLIRRVADRALLCPASYLQAGAPPQLPPLAARAARGFIPPLFVFDMLMHTTHIMLMHTTHTLVEYQADISLLYQQVPDTPPIRPYQPDMPMIRLSGGPRIRLI